MVRIACVAGLLLLMQSGPPQQHDVVPLLHAHAHNDYLHKPPLLAALEHGFTSVEADIFLVDGKGRRVRFWATPDVPSVGREAVWCQLLSAGVDLLNSDDLTGLQEFLLKHER